MLKYWTSEKIIKMKICQEDYFNYSDPGNLYFLYNIKCYKIILEGGQYEYKGRRSSYRNCNLFYIDPDIRSDWRCILLVANVLAKLDRKRDELETEQRDLKKIDNLLDSLQKQRAMVVKEIKDLEYQITELEEELDD